MPLVVDKVSLPASVSLGTTFRGLVMEIPRFGERIYKQVITNGNKVNKWVRLVRIEKYDESQKIYQNVNLIFENVNSTVG